MYVNFFDISPNQRKSRNSRNSKKCKWLQSVRWVHSIEYKCESDGHISLKINDWIIIRFLSGLACLVALVEDVSPLLLIPPSVSRQVKTSGLLPAVCYANCSELSSSLLLHRQSELDDVASTPHPPPTLHNVLCIFRDLWSTQSAVYAIGWRALNHVPCIHTRLLA